MNTNRPMSSRLSPPCHSRQFVRWPATSARSCSAARRTFFQGEPEGGQSPGERGDAERDLEFLLHFCERGVRLLCQELLERVGMGFPPRPSGLALPGSSLAALPSSLPEASDPGLADTVLDRDLADLHAGVAVSQECYFPSS